jgi:glycosyltransferase involved in cell wall biosynthesis
MAASSVLIPSYRRPTALARCLASLAKQTRRPSEVLVVWQGDDRETQRAADEYGRATSLPLRVVHSVEVGVVPAENAALQVAGGEILLFIDDDAVAPPDWVERHLAHYADATVGAVGGPAVNHHPDGTPLPKRSAEPVGSLAWYGKVWGNTYDHVDEWANRSPRSVHHLVGNNMSLRRAAVGGFETGLKPYWQLFELDACLQVHAAGLRVVFDFGLAVDHHPTNTAYVPGRDGDLTVKMFNAAYNHAFVLAKWTPPGLRLLRLAFLTGVGSVGQPGLLAYPVSVLRYGHPFRELRLLAQTLRHTLAGWTVGAGARAR